MSISPWYFGFDRIPNIGEEVIKTITRAFIGTVWHFFEMLITSQIPSQTFLELFFSNEDIKEPNELTH